MAVAEEKFDLSELKAAVNGGGGGVEEEEVEEEEDVSSSSDSEIGDALDLLDSKDDDYGFESGFTLNSRRPNAHGGIHSRHNSSTLQPLSNKNQKFSKNIRASPLEVGFSVIICIRFAPFEGKIVWSRLISFEEIDGSFELCFGV